ncbi:MAG: hypothetical protein NTZ83_04395 [Candidatus Pacearchaeota archaeon]|nr:hypothetical protein [Candidatus Pacearchaeota archaeon]
MPTQDASKIRERILSILRMKGPTIPVHISQELGISMLFASAFLSELLSDKLIKLSHMRVGNSPVYYIQGQEPQLERFSNYLKSKEKEAFLLLQEKKFLKDSEQTPAIRVALRQIKDFAFPFRRNNETVWRYLTAKESEFKMEVKPIEEHEYIEAKPKPFDKKEREIGEKIIKDIKIEDIEEIRKDKEKLEKKEEIEEEEEYITLPVPIPEKNKEEKKEEHPSEKKREKPTKEKPEKQKPRPQEKVDKKTKKKATPKQDNKFFDKIKEFLSKETIEIVNIESFNKNEILLRIKSEGTEKLLVAYNKKKILDTDIINANKKASQLNLKYLILCMGEPSKKLSSLIESAQNLEKIEKIEK